MIFQKKSKLWLKFNKFELYLLYKFIWKLGIEDCQLKNRKEKIKNKRITKKNFGN